MLPSIPVEGVVVIAHEVHCLTEQGFQNVLEYVKEDYDVKDCMTDTLYPHKGWWINIKDTVAQRLVVCDFCHKYSPVSGCKVHGFKCKQCGEVIYREYLPNAPLTFTFEGDEWFTKIALKIHSYQDDKLICYPDYVENNRGFYCLNEEKVKQLFDEHKGKYEEIEINGQKLLSFYYPAKYTWTEEMRAKIHISVYEVGWPEGDERKQRYRQITLYKGQEYTSPFGLDVLNSLPIPENFMVYKTFEEAPVPRDNKLALRILHAARQTGRCNYYSYDGRNMFNDMVLGWFTTYVEHFTDLNLDEFKKFLKICRLDGPGFLVHLADWVGKQTGISQRLEDYPDSLKTFMNNVVYRRGQYLTKEEEEALEKKMEAPFWQRKGGKNFDCMYWDERY